VVLRPVGLVKKSLSNFGKMKSVSPFLNNRSIAGFLIALKETMRLAGCGWVRPVGWAEQREAQQNST
jgi:hypothetical protein